jgi:hypothetical protein
MTELTKLFLELIKTFDSYKVEYYLIRNYENYPAEFTGDIDLYVDLNNIKRSSIDFERLFKECGWKIYKSLYRNWIYSFQLFCPDEDEDRRVIVIEMFNLFSWIEFEYMSAELIRRHKKIYNNMSVLPEEIGYFLSFCHYFYWAGFIPEKYKDKFERSFNNPDVKELAQKTWPDSILNTVFKEVSLYFANQRLVQIESIPEKIFLFPKQLIIKSKLHLLLKNMINPFSFLHKLMSIAGVFIKELLFARGNIIYFTGSYENATKLLFTLKKYHLFKNKNSKIENVNLHKSNIFNTFNFMKLYLKIFRGSIIIIPNFLNTNLRQPFLIKNKCIVLQDNEPEFNIHTLMLKLIK